MNITEKTILGLYGILSLTLVYYQQWERLIIFSILPLFVGFLIGKLVSK